MSYNAIQMAIGEWVQPFASGKAITTAIDKKKDPSFLTGLSSLTWLRYPRIRGLTKHHVTKVTIFVELTK